MAESSSNNMTLPTTKFLVSKVPNDVKSNSKHGGNVIHRTTSESLRIGGGGGGGENHTSGNGGSGAGTGTGTPGTITNNSNQNQRNKPKTSSFQITSVTVGTGRMSTDNGEDSADDLDESHTDDNSRITDLEETPSFSEDTFSKEDVFFSSNLMGTAAPVIPTSSQYGLAIVNPPDLASIGGHHILTDMPINVTDSGNLLNVVGGANSKPSDVDLKDLNHRNERFKVVKIESTEPFKRGRWMCMDYLDHTTLQQNNNKDGDGGGGGGGGEALTNNNNPVTTNDSGVNFLENSMDIDTSSTIKNDISTPNTIDNNVKTQQHVTPNHPQSMINMNVTSSNILPTSTPHMHQQHHQHQTMPQGHIQQILTQQHNELAMSVDKAMHPQYYATTATTANPQNLANHIQGATLPVNHQIHQQQHAALAQQQHQSMINLNVHHQHQSMDQPQHHIDPQQQQMFQQASAVTGIGQQQPQIDLSSTQSPTAAPDNQQHQNILPVLQQQNSTSSNVSSQSTSTLVSGVSNDSSLMGALDMAGAAGGAPASATNTGASENSNDGAAGAASLQTTTTTTTSSVDETASGMSQPQQQLSNQIQAGTALTTDDGQPIEDSESASGTSAVAIDNKIEQAMDLVKSHLMFAVREEVEVLKEKIAELMDRINQLEIENTILKANASQETLSQLSATVVSAKVTTTNATNPANGPVS